MKNNSLKRFWIITGTEIDIELLNIWKKKFFRFFETKKKNFFSERFMFTEQINATVKFKKFEKVKNKILDTPHWKIWELNIFRNNF